MKRNNLLILISFLILFSGCRKEFTAPYLYIKLKDLNGKDHRILDYKGKILILDFWATWCKPCKEAAPIMDLLKEKSNPEHFVFLAVNTDDGVTLDEIKRTAEDFGINYTSLLDPNLELANALKVEGQPAIFVFNRKGENIYHQYGIDPTDVPGLLQKMEEWER